MSQFPGSLLDGYRSFKANRFARESARYRTLAEQGQSPQIMVIGCSDSRSAPETLFGAAPGEIFVVRNVANLVPPCDSESGYQGTSAALEFAVQGLGVGHIVVLGHSRCGGIQAALQSEREPLSAGDFIGKWVDLLAPAAGEVETGVMLSAAERQKAVEQASIRRSVANLRTFPFVSSLEDEGRLYLHGAWFDIASGELWTLNTGTGTFSKAV